MNQNKLVQLCLLTLATTFIPIHSSAAPSEIEPKIKWLLLQGGDSSGIFETTEEAMSAVRAYVARDYPNAVVGPLAPCDGRPRSDFYTPQITLNGIPAYWCALYDRSPGRIEPVYTAYVSPQRYCPDDVYSLEKHVSVPGGSVKTCIKPLAYFTPIPPNSCPAVPTPIYTESGTKFQAETDYVDPQGLNSLGPAMKPCAAKIHRPKTVISVPTRWRSKNMLTAFLMWSRHLRMLRF
jgi:hypothetical protein